MRTPVNMDLPQKVANVSKSNCPVLFESAADIDTIKVYPSLDFNPLWIGTGNFWNHWFDSRVQDLNRNSKKLPLKVIIVPHSHNDPGWLETFEYYLQVQSIHILNNVVDILQRNETFKFIWAEVAFLEGWWKTTSFERRMALRQLIREGQVEVVTGGWVMPDEAVTSLYALIDQYIEGHQWLKRHLDVVPQYGWSIDTFGHSSTVAHLLSLSGITATVIQRIHFAWKYWFAYQRSGDFYWLPNHSSDNFILTHNQPFHLYGSSFCGPKSFVCSFFNYNTQKPNQFYVETFVDGLEALIIEYIKSGSLFKHNVILVSLGEDFSYVEVDELLGNYAIYSIVIEQTRKKYPSIDISFGTVKDYFEEIYKRQESFPTLRGDFFVYADPFSYQPSYWSGFYSSRPFLKILGKILEAQLRSCEILYTITLNYAHFTNSQWDFLKIVDARRVLGLLQHHDAITGTSKSFVVKDYIIKISNAIFDILGIQRNTIEVLYGNNASIHLVSEDNIDTYEDISNKQVYDVHSGVSNHIVLFNSLLQPRSESVRLVVNDVNAKIINEDGVDVPIQISPVWKYNQILDKLHAVPDKYEVTFIATIPALTVVMYQLYYKYNSLNLAHIFSNNFHQDNESAIEFVVKNISLDNYIKFDNSQLSVVFSGQNGFLRKIYKKSTKTHFYTLQDYIAYNSCQFRSGPYLFEPDPHEMYDKNLFRNYNATVMVIMGNIYSEIIVVYKQFIVQKVTIFHTDTYLAEAVFLESTVNLQSEEFKDIELAMKLITNINNKNVFYTDANGFQIQKRLALPKIAVQGNYYPITSMIYIEDETHRLSLLTSHSLGGTSFRSGQLEVMLDRSILREDGRGLDEGLLDNKVCTHKFILLVEVLHKRSVDDLQLPTPSYLANHLSNSLFYPVNIYVNKKSYTVPASTKIELMSTPPPCSVHLLNLRTQPHYNTEEHPSSNALLVLHRQTFGCGMITNFTCTYLNNSDFIRFNYAIIKYFKRTSLTGIENQEESNPRQYTDMLMGSAELRTYNVTFK